MDFSLSHPLSRDVSFYIVPTTVDGGGVLFCTFILYRLDSVDQPAGDHICLCCRASFLFAIFYDTSNIAFAFLKQPL